MTASSWTDGAHPPWSGAFWRAYGVTMRPYLCFVSGVSGLVGLALGGPLRWPAFVAAAGAFFLSYGFGQALTDVFQTDTDALSSPYRPLTQRVVSRRDVLLVSLAGLAGCGVVLAALNLWTVALSALAVLGLIAYTPFKRRWWAGPFWNAWVAGCLPAIGVLCGGADPTALWMLPRAGAAVLSVFLSYAVFVLLGYFKDISADRATGYRTLPVVAGWRPAVAVSCIPALGAAAASAWLVASLWNTVTPGDARAPAALVLWAVGIALLVGAHPRMLRTRSEAEAHGPIGWCVRGYVLVHLGESALAMPQLLGPAGLAYVLFEGALAGRPERSQI